MPTALGNDHDGRDGHDVIFLVSWSTRRRVIVRQVRGRLLFERVGVCSHELTFPNFGLSISHNAKRDASAKSG